MTDAIAKLKPSQTLEVQSALNQCVADTVVATMLAQNCHWNVRGRFFIPLHQLFQEIYEDHFEAQDDLAERLRAIGGHVEARLSHIVQRSTVREHTGHASDVEMIAHMLEAQQALAASAAACAERAAGLGDTLTEDPCIARGQQHEKFAWMLRAQL